MSTKQALVYGVSQGLGKALADSLLIDGYQVFGVSRTQPANPEIDWIAADLANPEQALQLIQQRVAGTQLDALIYNVGIWESTAFSADYDFQQVTAPEMQRMLQINTLSCLLAVQGFIDNLKQSSNAKIILIGSTWGVDNHAAKEVAFSATKYALRGITHALREVLRPYAIGVSVLNLGYLATEYDLSVPTEQVLAETERRLIPLTDVVQAVRFILSTSSATCVKELLMPAMADLNL